MKDFSSFQCRILNKSPELMANGLFSFLSRQKWKVKESNCINHYQKKKKKLALKMTLEKDFEVNMPCSTVWLVRISVFKWDKVVVYRAS